MSMKSLVMSSNFALISFSSFAPYLSSLSPKYRIRGRNSMFEVAISALGYVPPVEWKCTVKSNERAKTIGIESRVNIKIVLSLWMVPPISRFFLLTLVILTQSATVSRNLQRTIYNCLVIQAKQSNYLCSDKEVICAFNNSFCSRTGNSPKSIRDPSIRPLVCLRWDNWIEDAKLTVTSLRRTQTLQEKSRPEL